jgi:5-methylcytosine-specific restriction endonuclease McrBC GTP-binding regulatory subunit McrB
MNSSETHLEPVVSTWQPFFHEMAEKVLTFEDRQPDLINMLRDAGVKINEDSGVPLEVLDPFSFVSLILKHTSEPNVLKILARLVGPLSIVAPLPTDLTGVPWSNAMNGLFFDYRDQRQPEDLPTLWALAKQTMLGELQAETFERALSIRRIGLPKLTQGMFWLNPKAFLALNSVNVPYLESRGIRGVAKISTLPELNAVLEAARMLAPDFTTLSYTAWLGTQDDPTEAKLEAGCFPFQAFRNDVKKYESDHIKGNMILDRKYAPLLLGLLQGEDFLALRADRAPFNGKEQLAVKISLSANIKGDEAAFGRALLFADDNSFDGLPLEAGLTLEVGLPEGKGEAVRHALRSAEHQDRFLELLLRVPSLFRPIMLSLGSDLGTLTRLPVTLERGSEVQSQLDAYANGDEKNRRLRIAVTISPDELVSEDFVERLADATTYLDNLKHLLDDLMRQVPPTSSVPAPAIQPAGASVITAPSIGFTPPPGVPLNQILYGPPGTGKTFQVVDKALEVLDPEFLSGHQGSENRPKRKARYDNLVDEGRVTFVTFHQSFGYEDFIEGIKPVMKSGQLSYELEDGLFLQAVIAAGGILDGVLDRAQAARSSVEKVNPQGQVWRIYIDGTVPVSQLRSRSLERGEIRMGSWLSGTMTLDGRSPIPLKAPMDLSTFLEDRLNAQQLAFKDAMRIGDVVLLATGNDLISAVGVVTGEYRFDVSETIFASDFAHSRAVRWLAKDLNLKASQVIGKPFAPPTLQRVVDVKPQQILNLLTPEGLHAPVGLQSHVLIIDEINRGNVAKVFGELITLLEPSKRAGAAEALTVRLPLSKRTLGIPQSLYLIGTMNTADRSLTLLDAALRRRFVFHPVWPEPEVLPVITLDGTALDLRLFLKAINGRVERLLSREQVIGHAYLLDVPQSLEGVAQALQQRILPLLEEYFFEDWGQIRQVLGDDQKPPGMQFIREVNDAGGKRYERDKKAFEDIESYVRVYSGASDTTSDT